MTNTTDERDRWVADLLDDLPMPAPSPGFFPGLMQRIGAPLTPAGGGARRSASKVPRRVLGFAAVLALSFALLSGFALGASVSADADDPVNDVTSFAPAVGWNTVTTTFGPSGQKLSIAWAANVAFSPNEDLSGFPTKTVEGLADGGIVIAAIGPREYTGDTSFPQLVEPLSLSHGRCVWDEYEGQPAPNVSRCMVDVMVDGRLLNVLVWFGMTEPTDDVIAAANDELGRLAI